MLTAVILASSSPLNAESALPSEQDVPDGQKKIGKRDSIGKSLMPHMLTTTHSGILARAAENQIAPSPRNDHDTNVISNLRIVYRTWSMFVPLAEASHGLSQM